MGVTFFTLFILFTATIVLLVELREGASTTRAVTLSSLPILVPGLGFAGWAILRSFERRNGKRFE